MNLLILITISPYLLLLLYVWSGVPSSQSLVALSEAELGAEHAAKLSRLYVPMYCTSIITVPMVVAVAILLIGDSG